MVDALRRAARHLRPSGVLIDARPDGTREARLIQRRRVIGRILPHREVATDDATADEAVDGEIAFGHLRSVSRGHLWHETSFRDRRDLDEYLRDSPRYERLSPDTRIPYPRERLVMRRAIKYEIFRRT